MIAGWQPEREPRRRVAFPRVAAGDLGSSLLSGRPTETLQESGPTGLKCPIAVSGRSLPENADGRLRL